MDDFNKKIKKIIYFFISIFIITLLVIIICLLMLKYEVEGENNMPFELSQVVVVSTAEGISIDGEKTWNMDLKQNNDVYLHISKNRNYKETEIIKNIVLNNFTVNEQPKKGNIVIYRPAKDENIKYEYSEEFIVKDALIYNSGETTDLGNLKIANQGGVISIRYLLDNLRNLFIR